MIFTKNYIQALLNKSKKTAKHILVIILCAVGLAACSKKDEVVETGIPLVENAVEAGLEDASVLSGGQLTTFIPIGATSLNPLYNDSLEMHNLLLLSYEKLIHYNEQLLLSPLLAESWSVGIDKKTWTINLRKDVYWHDGTPLTTADVIYTLDLLMSPEYGKSPYHYNLDEIESYSAIDSNTLVVVGVDEGEFALHALTVPIVSSNAFMTSKSPVGTGPYVLKYADPSVGLQFELNENWWKKKPYIARIVAHALNDDTTALNELVENKLNFVATNSYTANTYQEEGNRSALLIPTQRNEVLLLNQNNIMLHEKEMRKSIAHALDRRDIVSKIYLGHAFIVDVPIQPKSVFYDPEVNNYDYNIDKSREMLESMGWKDLDGDGIREKSIVGEGTKRLSLRLLVNDTSESTAHKAVSQMIKNQLELVGIEVRIINLEYSSESSEYLEELTSGKFEMALVGIYMDKAPDYSALLDPGAALNFGNYSNYDMQNTILDIKKSTEEDQLKNITQFQKLFVSDVPLIELYFLNSSIVFSDKLVIENAAMISEEEVFRGIEGWHFTSEGLTLYPLYELSSAEAKWSAYYIDPSSLDEKGMKDENENENMSIIERQTLDTQTSTEQAAPVENQQSSSETTIEADIPLDLDNEATGDGIIQDNSDPVSGEEESVADEESIEEEGVVEFESFEDIDMSQ